MLNHPILRDIKRYRTWVNEKAAIISVNMGAVDKPFFKTLPKVAHITRHYDGFVDGLPYSGEKGRDIFAHIVTTINLLSALPNALYAGHILSDQKSQIFFYLENETQFLETLDQLKYDDVLIQQDESWDTFFDFLLPSSVEAKINLSEEMIDSLVENGVDLSVPQVIEHCFHFEDKSDIEIFFERCNAFSLSFDSCKYTEIPVQLENNTQVYIVKLQQETLLNTKEFYLQVELFEDMIIDLAVYYVGWEFFNVDKQRKYLN